MDSSDGPDEKVEDMVERGIAKSLVEVLLLSLCVTLRDVLDSPLEIIQDEDRDLQVRHYSLSTLRNIAVLEKNKVRSALV